MTLTLHWWMLPLALVVYGFVALNRQRMDWDFGPTLVFFGCMIVALALVVGHFL